MKASRVLFVVALFLIVPRMVHAQASQVAPHPDAPAAAAFLAQLGTPAPIFLADCTASTNCPCLNGPSIPISCTGTTSCAVVSHNGRLSVQCDGVYHDCPGLTHC